MKKVIRKSGNGLYVRVTSDDQEIYGFKEGDVIDIEWCKSEEHPEKRIKAKGKKA